MSLLPDNRKPLRLMVAVASVIALSAADLLPAAAIPASIISLESDTCLVVEKSRQQLSLFARKDGSLDKIKTYACTTGKNHGDKTRSGDRKTPEGVYFFKRLFTDTELPSRYGAMAFVLDFPNYLDRMERKGGNGIWLHGLDRPLQPFDSKGCIALTNKDITDISSHIKLFETPIIIEETFSYGDTAPRLPDYRMLKSFLGTWRDAWEHKHLENYIACYSPTEFKKGRFREWVDYKQSLNSRYKFIDVELQCINYFVHDTTYIVTFIQDYESDSFSSVGMKKLFLRTESDTVRIVGEDWTDIPRQQQRRQAASPERELVRMLNRWVRAWEDKNSDAYRGCYSERFISQGMSLNAWIRHKNIINRNNSMIRVAVIRPRITIDGDEAKVEFTQQYMSDSYTDYGLKKLDVVKEGKSWKIIAESWEPI